MSDSSCGNVKEISLGDGFGDVALRVNGARIEVHCDGSVDAYTNGPVKAHPAANDLGAKTKTAPEIGNEMEDGTILAGYYEGKPLYATPRDAPGTYTFNEAASYAKDLDAHVHHDFRVPTKGELNVLRENRNKGKLAGTFNETGSSPAGWYWSSSTSFGYYTIAWTQRFSDGNQNNVSRNAVSSLRCVR